MELFFAVCVVGLLAGVLLFYFAQRRRNTSTLSKLAETLGSHDISSGHRYTGELDGTRYSYQYQEGSRNSPSHFMVMLDAPSPAAFQVTREGRLERFFKGLGFTVEVQTGESRFDREFFLQTDTPGFARQVFSGARQREAIRRLFRQGFNRVTHDGKTLNAKVSPFKLSEDNLDGLVETAVRALRDLAEDLSRYDIGAPRRTREQWKTRRTIAYGISITLAVAGTGLLLWGNAAFTPLDKMVLFLEGLGYAVPAFGAFLIFLWYWLKGHSTSHTHLLVNLCIAVVALPAAAYGGLMVANGALDTAPPREHVAAVLGRHYSSTKNGKNYYLHLRSWRTSPGEEQLQVDHGTYQRAPANQAWLGVTTRAGHLGHEWLVGYRLVERDVGKVLPTYGP